METLREILKSYCDGNPENFFDWCNKNLDKKFSEIGYKNLLNIGNILSIVGGEICSYVRYNCKHTNTKKEYDIKEVCLDCGMSRYYIETDEEGLMGAKLWKWTDWSL